MNDDTDDRAAAPDDAPDREMNAREREMEAMLALTSTPPASLDARVRARRAANERVILPVPGSPSVDVASSPSPTPWRRHAATLAMAAAAAVAGVIATRVYDAARARSAPAAPRTARADSMRADSVRNARGVAIVAAPAPPSADRTRRRDVGATPGAAGGTSRRDDIGMGLDAPRTARPLFSARLLGYDDAIVDSAGAAALRAPAARVGIAYAAGNAGLVALARRIEQALIARGVAASRISVEAGASTDDGPLPVMVTVSAPVAPR